MGPPYSFMENESTQKSLLSKRGKPCNNSVPTNGKTDIPIPGLTKFCPRPSTVKNSGFLDYGLCSCSKNKFAAQVAVTTCAPCCPGSAMMANTCANAQDGDAETDADTETEKKNDAAAKKSQDKKVAQELKNLKVTELEDEVEVLDAGSDAKARRLL